MDRAAFTQKMGTMLFHDLVCLYQNMPEAVDRDGVIRGVDSVFLKPDGVLDFNRPRVDLYLDPQSLQRCHQFPVKLSYRARDERDGPHGAVAGQNKEIVIDEVEIDLKDTCFVGDR